MSENKERTSAEKKWFEIHEEFRLALTDLLSDAYAVERYAQEEQKEDALYSPAVMEEYIQRDGEFFSPAYTGCIDARHTAAQLQGKHKLCINGSGFTSTPI